MRGVNDLCMVALLMLVTGLLWKGHDGAEEQPSNDISCM